MLISYCVFSIWVFGSMLPMWLMRDAYFEMIREGYGDAYTDSVLVLLSNWIIPVIIASIIVGAIAGAYLGRSVLTKHFKKAGIA